MRNLLYILIFILPQISSAQPLNISGTSPSAAINNFIGPGIIVSNVSFKGGSNQVGLFTGGSEIGMAEGMALTTGNVSYASQSQTAPAGNQQLASGTNETDVDLNALSGTPFNASVLEFDFISASTSASFEFVFASEEYPEYVGSSFNDVFGFFLSGPGINGPFSNNAINIAKLPNGSPITVNTVNHISNTAFYVDNAHIPGVPQVVYDGFTKLIKIDVPVECGQTYHLKIGICNITDANYDSGIFLKKASFNSTFVVGPLTASPLPVCEGQPINLSVTGDNGYTYTWSTGQSGSGLRTINTIAQLGTTQYSVTVDDGIGCQVTRTVDVVVHSNTNTPPYVNGIDNTGNYTYYTQAGDNFCFTIPSFDIASEQVTIDWNQGISGADFTPNPGFHESGTFCWDPELEDIGEHTFVVTVEDDNKCNEENQSFTFTVIVVCDFCPVDIYYENRSVSTTPLPNETQAGNRIFAGTSVDPSQQNGPVVVGNGEDVKFEAGGSIILETGFRVDAGGKFLAQIVPGACVDDCQSCCSSWDGFTQDFFPNVFTPNGDGVNDVWYLPDTDNPFCAFNAQGFELSIFNRFGTRIWHLQEQEMTCCPFRARAPNNPIPYSSIYWPGTVNDGPVVSEGTYFYTLTLIGCGQTQGYNGTITVLIGGNAPIAEGEDYLLPEQTAAANITIHDSLSAITVLPDKNNVDPAPIIYPNPVRDELYIEFQKAGTYKIDLLTTTGSIVMSKEFPKEIALHKLSLSDLSEGIYMLKIYTPSGVFLKRLIKQ